MAFESRKLPSGETRREVTVSVCPAIAVTTAPLRRSHALTTFSMPAV